MHLATQITERTIAVLSRAYLESAFSEQEWQAAWAEDPSGVERKLLVLRIEDCPCPGLLGQVVSEDMFGVVRNWRGRVSWPPFRRVDGSDPCRLNSQGRGHPQLDRSSRAWYLVNLMSHGGRGADDP
jgi:hypothetical protein